MRRAEIKKWQRPRVGLALSGGAARGAAHVGVLRTLLAHGVPVDCVAGTSAGALVGGAFAAGVSLAEIAAFGRTMRWRDFGKLTLSRLGVQSNARMEEYVRARFPVTRFEELPLPFAAVATDLRTGAVVVLRDQGDVAFAIRASCAIPGWYVPVVDEAGRQLVDGGLVANVPVTAARALGADIVVAVDVNAEGAKFLGSSLSAIGVLLQSFLVVQRTATAQQLREADVVIAPKVGHIRWDEMTRADELIAAGEEAALAALAQIKALLAPPALPVAAEPNWLQRLLRRPTPAAPRLERRRTHSS
ncbi:MAG TPA: patatin-like phospholipase family protein [Pyrinomonadaceae bacterium]|jgi:NTE family protein|nr:patatin-like phospholipase family protein [Pyrinomonadaceae bacterium]